MGVFLAKTEIWKEGEIYKVGTVWLCCDIRCDEVRYVMGKCVGKLFLSLVVYLSGLFSW